MAVEDREPKNGRSESSRNERNRLNELQFRDFDDGIYIVNEAGEKIEKISPETHPAEFQEWQDRVTSALGLGTKEERDAINASSDTLSDRTKRNSQNNLRDQIQHKNFTDLKIRQEILDDIEKINTEDDVLAIGRRLMEIPDLPQTPGDTVRESRQSRGLERAQQRILDQLEDRFETLRRTENPMSIEAREAFKERIAAVENTTQLQSIFNEIRRYPQKTAEQTLREQDHAARRRPRASSTEGSTRRSSEAAPAKESSDGLTEEERARLKEMRERLEREAESLGGKAPSAEESPPEPADATAKVETPAEPAPTPRREREPRRKYGESDLVVFEENGVRRVKRQVNIGNRRYPEYELRDIPEDAARRHLEMLDRQAAERSDTRGTGAHVTGEKTLEQIEAENKAQREAAEGEPEKRRSLGDEYGYLPGEERSRRRRPDATRRIPTPDEPTPSVEPAPGPTRRIPTEEPRQPVRQRRTVYQWFKDFISGTDSRDQTPASTEPTPHELLDAHLNQHGAPESVLIERALTRRLTEAASNIERDARIRELEGRLERVDTLRKFRNDVVRSYAIAGTVAVLLASTGIASVAVGSILVGPLAGVVANRLLTKYGKKEGRSKFGDAVTTWFCGTAAGVVAGALAGNFGVEDLAQRVYHSLFDSPSAPVVGDILPSPGGEISAPSAPSAEVPTEMPGDLTPQQPSGPTTPSAPAPAPGAPILSPDLVTPTIAGNEGVWSNLTDGLKSIEGLDDIGSRGRNAFAHAFEGVIEDMGLKGELLGDKLANVDWKAIPDGTVVRFDKIFDNPEFLEALHEKITSDYKTLVKEIGGRANVGDFIESVAKAYTRTS